MNNKKYQLSNKYALKKLNVFVFNVILSYINLLLLTFIFSITVFTHPTYAEIYYIATSGADSNNGSMDSPWGTLNHAQAQLSPGDTLYVRGGTYTQQCVHYSTWTASGGASDRVTISGYQNEEAIFDGDQGLSCGGGFIYDIRDAQYITIKNLEFTNYKNSLISLLDNCSGWIFDNLYIHEIGLTPSAHVSSITISGSSDIIIRNCTMVNVGNSHEHHHIYAGANTYNWEIYNNYLAHSSGACIHGWHGPGLNGAEIYNNIITDSYFGIIFGDGAQNLKIFNNTLVNNDYGLDFNHTGQDDTSGVSTTVVKNNIVVGGDGFRIGAHNLDDVTEDYNLYFPTMDTDDRGANSITANSSFVDQSGDDFHIRSDSGAIDRGVTIESVRDDLDGILRGQSGFYDIGAYEYIGGILTTTPSRPQGFRVKESQPPP